MLNYEMTKQPISKSGERYWMVTLSTNNLTENNKNLYLKKEGSIYILPDGKDIKYWYNASDNKFYEPGSKVVVRHGMHFMKISK